MVFGETQGTERRRLDRDPTEHQGQNQTRTCVPKFQLSVSPFGEPPAPSTNVHLVPAACRGSGQGAEGMWEQARPSGKPPHLSEETDIEQIIADILTKGFPRSSMRLVGVSKKRNGTSLDSAVSKGRQRTSNAFTATKKPTRGRQRCWLPLRPRGLLRQVQLGSCRSTFLSPPCQRRPITRGAPPGSPSPPPHRDGEW